MTRERRPSGLSPKQRRFATRPGPDGSDILIPLTQDAATYIYVCDDNGEWVQPHAAKLLYDAMWLTEGTIINVENLAPPMGMIGYHQVVEVRLILSIDQPRKGTQRRTKGFGQVKRLVLLQPLPEYDLDEEPIRLKEAVS